MMNNNEILSIGDEYPVWWETNDGRPAGSHMARVLEIRPYTGVYPEFFTHILKLAAPNTRRGWLEMTVEDLKKREW